MRHFAVSLLVCASGCASPGAVAPPGPAAIAGTYDGTLSSGQVTWTLRQDSTRVSGDGTFVSAADQSTSSYTLRGTVTYDSIFVRLLGAPGDSDADSVTYRGSFLHGLLAGTVATGLISGPSIVLHGPLTVYRRGTP